MRATPQPCPLCGNRAVVTRLDVFHGPAIYNISCGVRDDDSDSCGLVLFGGARKRREVIERWNHRHEGKT